jgi:eukaryotic-like serine/threonine-protein kinase
MKICPQCSLRYPDSAERCAVHDLLLVDYTDPRLGTLVAGRYEIEEAIGEGGMATVYRAKQKPGDRVVAIKILSAHLHTDEKLVERFRREARHVASIAHPNIIQIFEPGQTEDGRAYIAMEFLHGTSLASLIEQGPVSFERALSIMIQICRGLARAHDLGVIHRDLKPENIYLNETPEGELVKIIDFGIARSAKDTRLTGTGELFGTPQYMSPQRISGEDPSTSDDIYSLGIVFFEILTGKLPFDANDVATFFLRHLRSAPKKPRELVPDVPESMEDLVMRMLAKKAPERPADAHAIETELLILSTERELPLPGNEIDASEPSPHTPKDPPQGMWPERIESLQSLVTEAFGDVALAPAQVEKQAARLPSLLGTYNNQRAAVQAVQHELAILDGTERDMRVRFGKAVAALGQDASRIRSELKDLEKQKGDFSGADALYLKRFREAFEEICSQEGRSGLQHPVRGLATAYRSAADLVDQWLVFRDSLNETPGLVAEKEKQVTDIDYQLASLRTALVEEEDSAQLVRQDHAMRLGEATRLLEAVEQELAIAEQDILRALRVRPELLGKIESHEQLAPKTNPNLARTSPLSSTQP